ncbi:MAG: UDP-N-acetylmuramate dehydrogenase [Candidatus Moranbacteria bacterium]|nr:UDP-N-acetylmuramate dehydrogenase [Candidatus Moranbacteria bacterium]
MKNKIKKDVSLKDFSTFKIGGPASFFVETKSKKELEEALRWAKYQNLKYFILGGGSNILFSDEGFEGLIVKISNDNLEEDGKNKVVAGAGVKLGDLVNFSAEKGLKGLEWAAGIPGTVGGAVRGNAGAFGGEMKDSAVKVKAFKINEDKVEAQEFSKSQCGFDYRESIFKRNNSLIIWEIELAFKRGNKKEIQDKIKEITKSRKEKQPSLNRCFSAGSVFKNPNANKEVREMFEQETGSACKDKKVPAGWLIDMCDLKGLQVGDAKISPDQANFIINEGNAKSHDVVTLISLIKQKVRHNFGIQLQEELQLVGF